MSTAAVFLDINKAFDTTWQPGLLYKLSKLQFSNSLIKLISSFLSQRKFRVLVEDEVPQGSVLSPTPYNLYINDTPQTSGVNLALFADDTCVYATGRKEGYVLIKIQHGLDSVATWCKPWNITLTEAKTRANYCTHRNRPPDSLLK
jgi:hypothetical protein